MSYRIIVDSCCDITPQLAERMGGVASVPLTMRLGAKEFVDDDTLNLPGFMVEMKACKERITSASPSPLAYKEAMEAARQAFVVTLSSQLSGSYSSAELGKTYAGENGVTNTHVFDSKSASAGEVLVALKIHELISEGKAKAQIISEVSRFIDNMKTYFVLANYDNLQKNGRLNKITGKLISMLNVKLIMGADGEGSIALYAKPRGTKQMMEKLMEMIKDGKKITKDATLVIAHCNNAELAGQLESVVRQRFEFKEILIVPTRGLSSLYADDKGVVMAF